MFDDLLIFRFISDLSGYHQTYFHWPNKSWRFTCFGLIKYGITIDKQNVRLLPSKISLLTILFRFPRRASFSFLQSANSFGKSA